MHRYFTCFIVKLQIRKVFFLCGGILWRAQKDSLDTLCLRGNRNDLISLCLPNLLVVEPFVASQLLSGSHTLGRKLKKRHKADFEFMARPFIPLDEQ